MYIVHVNIHVKPDTIDSFIAATLQNAQNSVNEAGVARFDVLQSSDDPTRFTLVEVYRTSGDVDLHKQTQHYLTWRDTVAEMMAEPRVGVKFVNLFPGEDGWD